MEILKIADLNELTIKTVKGEQSETETYDNEDDLYRELSKLRRMGFRRVSEAHPKITLALGAGAVGFAFK